MIDFKERLANKLSEITNIDKNELLSYIEIPPNSSMGDYAFPCFKLAKELRKAPPAIASDIKNKICEDWIEKVDVVGGYLNFFIKKEVFVKEVLDEIQERKEDYGKSDLGKGKTVVIDYSAPNVAKPFHIGHLRSTVIGGALYKMYKFMGYNVVGVNHLGDWGMGICRTIAGYRMWKDEYDFSVEPIKSILAIYVRYNKIEKEDPDFKKYAVEELKKLEDGDKETTEIWKWIIKISLCPPS